MLCPHNPSTQIFYCVTTFRSTNEAESDADDWDWDEGEGDVELAQEPENTHRVAGTSFGKPRSKTPPSQKKQLIRRSSSKDKQDISSPQPVASRPGLNLHGASHGGPSWQGGAAHNTALHHRNNHLDQPQGALAPSPMSAPVITKLGAPKPTATKLPIATKPKADDFFAEFDLAAKPSFGKPTARPLTTAKTQPSATQLTADANDFNDDWGDDDLDDLLDD
jgi:hypothetical protein